MFFLGPLPFLYMLSIEMLMTSRQHIVGGDGSKGAGGPGARTAHGAADSGVSAAADTDDVADATAAADDAAAAGTDELADEPDGSVFSTGSIPAPPPYSMPWMPPPPTQSPGTPVTVNNLNIIRSMNRGESSCAQPATCTCSSVQYANANVHSINLIDYMSQGNDDEAGGSGGGQG